MKHDSTDNNLKIDELDKDILRQLSKSARTPFKDIAEVCNVSRAAVHQRVQRMIDNGVILGSMFIINPKSVGYMTCTYIGIQLEKGSFQEVVAKELEKIPEIVECHFTTGPYSMLVKLYARDNEHLLHVLRERIYQIDGVASTETLISLEQDFIREVPIEFDEKARKRRKKKNE